MNRFQKTARRTRSTGLTEQQEAERFALWLHIKRFDFTHVPNETGSSEEARRRAVRMKRAGVSRGFPDYLIFANGHRIAIELKRKEGGKATPEQRKWLEVLASFGFECAVCHGALEAEQFVTEITEGVKRNATHKEDQTVF